MPRIVFGQIYGYSMSQWSCFIKLTIIDPNLSKPLNFFFNFNRRLITLQYCGGFCHTLTWISHGCASKSIFISVMLCFWSVFSSHIFNSLLKIFVFIYLATWGLSYSIWDLVPWLGVKPGPPALEVQSFSHWTTREVPRAWISWEWFIIQINTVWKINFPPINIAYFLLTNPKSARIYTFLSFHFN